MTTYISKWVVGLLCFIALTVLSMSWLLAAVCDPSWSFGNDTISCLGKSTVGAAKNLFNYGFCMLGGALVTAVGALYLFTKKTRLLHAIYAILIILGGVGLICVGSTPMDVDYDVHRGFAIATCVVVGILFILTTAEAWMDKKYFVASLFTAGIALFVILAAQDIGFGANLAQVEVEVIIFFLLMLAYYGIEWCTGKKDKVVSLYGNEVEA